MQQGQPALSQPTNTFLENIPRVAPDVSETIVPLQNHLLPSTHKMARSFENNELLTRQPSTITTVGANSVPAPYNTQQYGRQHGSELPTIVTDTNSKPPPIQDVSALMFPSTDPFAYPAQPVAAYENAFLRNLNSLQQQQQQQNATQRHQAQQAEQYQTQMQLEADMLSSTYPNAASSATSFTVNDSPEVALNGDIDMHFLDTVPMYIDDNAQFSSTGSHSRQAPLLDDASVNNANLEDLFGSEEWAGMFSEYGSWGQLEMGYAGSGG
jgi:hypothetical protein